MTIKKLYLDEFGNVITAEDGDSMSNGLLLNGVGLSAGREPNQNTEELVKRWNAYDANQQEIAELKQLAETKNARTLERIGRIERQEREISELKAMVNVLRRAADLYHGGYKVSELEEAAAIMNMSPAQCLQSVKADAVDEAAKWLSPETPAGEEGCELLRQYANEIREGKS